MNTRLLRSHNGVFVFSTFCYFDSNVFVWLSKLLGGEPSTHDLEHLFLFLITSYFLTNIGIMQ